MTSRAGQLHTRSTVRVRPPGLVAWLAAASALELVVLRTFTRTAIHIPGLEEFAAPYRVVALGARYAYFVAVVLLITVLPVAAFALWRANAWPARALSAAVAAFGLAAAAALVGVDRASVDVVTVSVVVFAAAAAAAAGGQRIAPALACFGVAFALSGTYTLIQGQALAVPAREQQWLLSATEVFGVAAALTLPLMARPHLPRSSLYAAGAVGLLTFGMFLSGGGSTARILLLWNEGLTGTLPAGVYAAAAATVASTVVALVRQHDLPRAAAVILLVTGGIGLHSTYQSGLVLIALVVFLLHAMGQGPAYPSPDRSDIA